MSSMIEVSAADLEGAALDWAVAIIEGYDVVVHGVGTYRHDKRGGIHCCKYGCTFGARSTTHDVTAYSPSEDWSQGGPLIDRFDVGFIRFGNSIVATTDSSDFDYSGFLGGEMHGPNRLISAMRAIVAAELGDTVDVPAELVEMGDD